ncbi:MAG: YtxH domain-containing protein [Anaerolineae bacterium]|nr:YtxH domain-containing protein [Anaerolineae bacterium]
MAKDNNGGMGVFTIGAILGTAAGAVIAYLFAPRSGKETIDDIEQSAADIRRQIEGDSVQDSLAAAKEEARRINQQP